MVDVKKFQFIYLGVRVDFIRWDRELEDGVLFSWCSGVVSGPSMLTAKTDEIGLGYYRTP